MPMKIQNRKLTNIEIRLWLRVWEHFCINEALFSRFIEKYNYYVKAQYAKRNSYQFIFNYK